MRNNHSLPTDTISGVFRIVWKSVDGSTEEKQSPEKYSNIYIVYVVRCHPGIK